MAASRLQSTLLALKEAGNGFFSRGKLGAAVDAYTEGIVLVGDVSPGHDLAPLASILHTNRGMCHKLLNQYEQMEADAVRARHLDGNNSKSHYLVGVAHCRRGEHVVGIRHLEQGLEKARRMKRPDSLLREFESAIAVGRAEWYRMACEEDRLHDSLLHSVLDDALHLRRTRTMARGKAGAAPGGVPSVPVTPPPAAVASSSSAVPPTSSGLSSHALRALPRRSVRYSVAVPPVEGEAVLEEAEGGGTASASVAGGRGRARATAPSGMGTAMSPAEAARIAMAAVKEEESDGRADGDDLEYQQWHLQLADVMAERERLRSRRDVPPHFLCPISFDVMLDPVSWVETALEVAFSTGLPQPPLAPTPSHQLLGDVTQVLTPSGFSYDRPAIERYLTRSGGTTDPMSRTPLTMGQLYPNLTLKKVIHDWLTEHPWAHPLLPEELRESDA